MSVIELKGVIKTYQDSIKNTVEVININHFMVKGAQQVAIEGLSGSGKSTLLNIIAGLILPTDGQVFVMGQDITHLSESKRDQWRAQHIGYVFQTFNLVQGFTVKENIMLAMAFQSHRRKIDISFIDELLKKVRLDGLGDRKPYQLSVGQQQRVAVARALANRPRIVLADEPTGNLDPLHTQETISLIQKICHEEQAALVLVSHDQHVLKQFKHSMKLSDFNRPGLS